jgi:hypothetical protein
VQAFFDERLFRQATADDFAALEKVGERAWAMHDQPDAGLWEFRTRTSVHTYSSVMSWAACDRLANAAGVLGLEERAALWSERAAVVRATIEREAWYEPEKRFAATFGGDELDASLLQLIDMRFWSPGTPVSAPRSTQSRRAFARASICCATLPRTIRLARDGVQFLYFLAYRGASHRRPHRGSTPALRKDARSPDAGRALSEDTDFQTGELWGNYPQTLFARWLDQLCRSAVPSMEFDPLSRLIVISNRVAAPKPSGRGRRAGRSRRCPVGSTSGISRPLVGWSGNKTTNLPARSISSDTKESPPPPSISRSRISTNIITAMRTRTLWPLFHYRIDLAEYDGASPAGYGGENERFAEPSPR